MMSHYLLASIDMGEGRSELHQLLHLTGAEISCNTLPAGVSIPFVHAHTENEEIYLVLDGSGQLYVDGEEVVIRRGDCFRIDPQGLRCLRAAGDSPLRYVCIQVRAGSLGNFTQSDAVVLQDGPKPSWL
ncbi:cupin domain-containing protein [uncultured Desulfovibrio sp.]|uniref:cupin domain-containing protein n=1 Tax=uncultured Desulfovibrio sp. TaxID=167968 RepID=UPI002626E310|nr:cupin domain-containing protein [uncultured Desulfovibrio sp.]